MKFSVIATLTAAMATGQANAFNYRFYDQANCDHSALSHNTWPPNNEVPASGSGSDCNSGPLGTNWQKVEVDGDNNQVVVYCDVGCNGGATGIQTGNCFSPPSGCAAGSFRKLN